MDKRQNRVGVALLEKDGVGKVQEGTTGWSRRNLDLEVGIATVTAPVQDGMRPGAVTQTTLGVEVGALTLLTKVVSQLDGEIL